MICPSNPPAPSGYDVWKGSVPTQLSSWAVACLKTVSKVPYGQTWAESYNGQTVVARKDYHTWTYRGGQLVTGICIPGITLYRPIPMGYSLSDVITNIETATPDPTLAVYDNAPPPETTDWPLVGVGVGTIALITTAFVLALRAASRTRKR